MQAPAAPLPLSDGDREILTRLAGSQTAPHRQVLRARVLLSAGDGVANTRIAVTDGCQYLPIDLVSPPSSWWPEVIGIACEGALTRLRDWGVNRSDRTPCSTKERPNKPSARARSGTVRSPRADPRSGAARRHRGLRPRIGELRHPPAPGWCGPAARRPESSAPPSQIRHAESGRDLAVVRPLATRARTCISRTVSSASKTNSALAARTAATKPPARRRRLNHRITSGDRPDRG